MMLFYDHIFFKFSPNPGITYDYLFKPRDNFGLEVVGGNLYAVGGSVIIGSEVGSDGVMTMAVMMTLAVMRKNTIMCVYENFVCQHSIERYNYYYYYNCYYNYYLYYLYYLLILPALDREIQ